jgi:hypothetical protein
MGAYGLIWFIRQTITFPILSKNVRHNFILGITILSYDHDRLNS